MASVLVATGSSAITPTSNAGDLATAMLQSSGTLSAASFVALPPTGTPNAVSTTPLAGFPTDGPSYTIMTSGDATLADQPNDSGSSGAGLGGANVRGNTDYDVSILKIDLNVPVGINCLSFDFRFLSDEFPEFVGGSVNDGFVAELDNSTWTTVDSVINAPNNFAFDPSGDVISINSSGATSMTAANATGTTYDGATPLLGASTPITPGTHSLYLSIFDQGDDIYDSAAFLDNLVLGTTAAGSCKAGATVLSAAKTADSPTTEAGGSNGYTITISNPTASQTTVDSISDVLPSGFSYTPGSTTGTTTANPGVSGQTLTWTGPFTVPASGSISLHFGVAVSSVPGDYFNNAGATASVGSISPTGPTAKVTVTEPPTSHADLAIVKGDAPDPVVAGSNLTYTLTVTNGGPDAAAAVQVSDTLPAGVSFVSASSSAGSCSGTATVVCSLGTVANGGSVTVTIVVTPSAAGSLGNTATVSSSTDDPVSANNSSDHDNDREPGAADVACGFGDREG